jgi:hypothetical protein
MKKFVVPPLGEQVYRRINPLLFDVSLRDGIQGADPRDYTTKRKIDLLHHLQNTYAPPAMEVGSFVSARKYPVMADTALIHSYGRFPEKRYNILLQQAGGDDGGGADAPLLADGCVAAAADKSLHPLPEALPTALYVLVPNMRGLQTALRCGVRNFSLITSASNAFQMQNTNMDLVETKDSLREMMAVIRSANIPTCQTKLYISCISECPLTGKLPLDRIVYEILSYTADGFLGFCELCLSDTMGTLRHEDFVYILRRLLSEGVDPDRLSLHLHIDRENAFESTKILYECFSQRVRRFDVSNTEQGGCMHTMLRSQMRPNMSYEFFYTALANYLDDDERHYLGL